MEVPPGILKNSRTQVAPIAAADPPPPALAYPLVRWEDQRNSSSISFNSSSMTISSLVDSEGYKSPHEPEHNMDKDLEQLDRAIVFIRQIPQEIERYINVPNRYEVVSNSGEKLYDVMETTDGVTRRLFRRDQPFSMRITNNYGEYICDLLGDPGIGGIGAYVTLSRGSLMWGKVEQIYPLMACCNICPSYNVYNFMGENVSRIIWKRGMLTNCCSDDETSSMFVYSTEAAHKTSGLIGSISRQEKTVCMGNYAQADTYTLSFHDAQMDTTHKALLVAAIILLDFQFFEGKENSRSKSWRLIVCCLLMGTILVFMALVALVVYFMAKSVKI